MYSTAAPWSEVAVAIFICRPTSSTDLITGVRVRIVLDATLPRLNTVEV